MPSSASGSQLGLLSPLGLISQWTLNRSPLPLGISDQLAKANLIETFCHGLSGRTVVIIGSFLCEGWCCWQNWHASTVSLISLETPSNHTDKLACSQHFVTLWWPAWIRSSISSLMTTGITMRSSNVNRSLLIDKCPGASNNSHIWSGTSPTRVGHSCDVNATTFWSWTCFAPASLIRSSYLSVASLVDSTKSTNPWTPATVSGSSSNLRMLLDRVSATYICLTGNVFC